MKTKSVISLLTVTVLALGSVQGLAQDRARDRAQVDRDQQVDRDRTFDRDRAQDRDRTQDRDRVDVPDRDRDRDRVRDQDFSQLRDQEIYGQEVMSAQERNQYREQLRDANSPEAREQLRHQHQMEMNSRAQAQGVSLGPNSEGPIYGGTIMTVQERDQYRAQLRQIESDQERSEFVARHREEMQERARRRGITLGES